MGHICCRGFWGSWSVLVSSYDGASYDRAKSFQVCMLFFTVHEQHDCGPVFVERNKGKTSLQGVEWICCNARGRHSDLGDTELGDDANDRYLLLVRVEGLDGVLETKLDTTIHNNANCGWSDTIVQRHHASRLDSFHDAIRHPVVLFHHTEVRTKDGTHIDEWVHQSVSETTSK